MKFDYLVKINDYNVLALIGYMVVCDNHIHSYELKILDLFIKDKKLGKEAYDIINNILNDKDDKVTFNDALLVLEKESIELQKEIIFLLMCIRDADENKNPKENEIIEKCINTCGLSKLDLEYFEDDVINIINNINEKNENYKNTNENKSKNIFFNLINLIKGLIDKIFKKGNDSTEIKYNQTIELCKKIAENDFEYISPIYKNIDNHLANYITNLENISLDIKNINTGIDKNTYDEVVEIVEGLLNTIKMDVSNKILNYNEELYKKQNAINNYTISLIGRTKAGKSTLHTVLTGEGKECIGVGMQRTTKFNRVYQWKSIRIIDTPGIGGAEENGRIDEEIANSVVGESDLICFITSDDTIHQDTLEMIEKLLARNKPIIILLNHKENIRNARFDEFIKKPNRWKEGDKIEGYINRINQYLDKKGYKDEVEIYSVFLLAALMSKEDNYSQYSELLYKSSNIEEFTNSIQDNILRSGKISRSKTILNDTSYLFDECSLTFENQINILKTQIEKLKNSKSTIENTLKTYSEDYKKQVIQIVQYKFNKLIEQDSIRFAEENYKNDEQRIQSNWNQFILDIRFMEELNNEIKKASLEYNLNISQLVNDLYEDISYAFKGISMDSSFNINSEFSFKNIGAIISSIVGLIGSFFVSGPLGCILTIGSALGGILSNLFKSKEEKRRESINNFHKQLKIKLEEQREKYYQDINDQICANTESIQNHIYKSLNNLIDGFNKILKESIQIHNKVNIENDKINKMYAWRIIEFLEDNYGDLNIKQDELFIRIPKVERNENEIKIYTTQSLHQDTKRLKNLIKENVNILKFKEIDYGE
ncbi:GTPase [Romboutsia timonensis]|uniref:GTPase n=1 Tax=Romboutsia timonensis TaxID=1776391 RepID=UPI003990D575